MTVIQKLVLAVSSAFLFISSSSNAQELIPGQVYNTSNIVVPTVPGLPSPWVNGVYQNNLTCWRGGDPGYCGPDAIVRPGNVINFSYGSTYVYQQQNISNLLPSTSGLQVTGYNFGFNAKNGNGWDDGRTDQLTALVRFWDTTGGRGTNNLLYGNSYNLNYKFNWTNFNFSENFTSPLNASSIGQVQYGFIGKDNNGWAGPYGPEIYNISFSLKYTVDPCSVNVLSSPSCPGYLSAINSLTPATTTTTLGSVAVAVPTSASLPTTSDIQPTTITVDAGGVEVSTSGTISAPDNIPQSVKEAQSQTQAEKQEEKSKSSPNMALVMSTIRQVQANDRAVQAASVQNALQEVSNAISNAQEQTNMAIENNQRNNAVQQQAAAESQSSSVVNLQFQNSQMNNQNNVQNFEPVQITNQFQQAPRTLEQVITQTQQMQVAKTDYSLLPPQPNMNSVSPNNVYQQKENQIELPIQVSFMGSDSPIKSILEQKPNIDSPITEQKTETVKSNVQPNEAAGGRDINSIAVVPAGFESYTNSMLRDVAFYKPDEIYKGQRTVDNARALRQLSSDRLHQEMVNQQYRN
jgi:hypothetical protein